jgi:hypothetical protein
MNIAKLLGSYCAASLVLIGVCSAQTTPYDDFNSSGIDPKKWNGEGGDPWLLDSAREIATVKGNKADGRLHLAAKTYAPLVDDNGGQGGVWGLAFAKPTAITAAGFTINVKKATVTGCTSNPDLEAANSAEFRGRFFNTEANPTSQFGDVELSIGPQRGANDDQQGPLQVVAFYQHCDDDFCGARSVLDYKVLGTIAPGSDNTASVQWDKPNHRFVFTLNGNQTISPYSVSDSSLPYANFKGIDVARVVPDCKGGKRPSSLMDASFDNVLVNP